MHRLGSVVTSVLAMALVAPWERDRRGCTSLSGTRPGIDALVLPPRSGCP